MSWTIDKAHTLVQFTVRHMMISKVRGQFKNFDGTVKLDVDRPANTLVDIQVETASIDTRDDKRDGHLRSADFFNSEAFPYMTFKSKKVEVLDDNHARLTGDLTIRDVTKEAVLDVEYVGQAKSPWGTVSYGFAGSTKINRKDWGLTWNVGLETGGVLVGDEVQIDIELELVYQPEAETAAAGD